MDKIDNDRDAKLAVQTLTLNLGVVGARLSTALQTMADQGGGYSSHASGSGGGGGGGMAISVAGDRVPVTGVEMQVLAGHWDDDRASHDRTSLFHHLSTAAEALRLAAVLVGRYGDLVRPSRPEQLGAIDSMWCPNCAKHKHFVPRGSGGKRALCNWCDDRQRALGFLPDQQMVDMHARGKRLTEADIAAAKARHEREAEATRRQAKIARKAEKAERRATENGSQVPCADGHSVVQVSSTDEVGVVRTDSTVRERGSDVEHVSDMLNRFQTAHES